MVVLVFFCVRFDLLGLIYVLDAAIVRRSGSLGFRSPILAAFFNTSSLCDLLLLLFGVAICLI